MAKKLSPSQILKELELYEEQEEEIPESEESSEGKAT